MVNFKQNVKKYLLGALTLSVLVLGLTAYPLKKAEAFGCTAGPYICTQNLTDADDWWESMTWTQAQMQWFNDTLYQDLFVDTLWVNNMRPALMQMTGQLVAAGVDTTGMIGGFFDAQQTLDTQLVLQELQARAIKDYTPGENLCRIGTGARSLSAADEKARTTALTLAEIAEDRLLGTKGGSGDIGPEMDQMARFKQFQRLYCNPGDNNGEMRELCGDPPTSDPVRFNKDIDFASTVYAKPTLDLDFSDGQLKADEEDVIALGSNLYGHEILPRGAEYTFTDPLGQNDNEYQYLNLRQVVALRSVAQNSYNAITGMRARGAAGSAQFLRNVLREMGMSEEEARRYIGGATAAGSNNQTLGAANGEPSYYAQLEILTNKLYQNPNFYVNLMDKPAEVERVQAAMEAVGLMSDWQRNQSADRQKMLLSLILELEIREAQEQVQRELETLGTTKND